jgi:hypothetical protein
LLSKQEGGFGIKNLHRKNRCLLLNFVHKLHQTDPLSWKDWFFSHTCRDLGDLHSLVPQAHRRGVPPPLPCHHVCDGGVRRHYLLLARPMAPQGAVGAAVRHLVLPLYSPPRDCGHGGHPRNGITAPPHYGCSGGAPLVLHLVRSTTLRGGHDMDSPTAPRFSSREAYRMKEHLSVYILNV